MKQLSGRFSRVASATLISAAALAATSAQAIVFPLSGPSNNSGDTLSATVEFLIAGTTLTVIVTNTQATASSDGGDVLDGVYFDIAGNPGLSNGNVFLEGSSSFVNKNNVAAVGGPLNEKWMYDTNVLGRMYAMGSTGFPAFNQNTDSFDEVFHGGNPGTAAGSNSDYGIVPILGITAGNTSNVYVNNALRFTFDLPGTISESDISNVWVSYGSSGDTILTPEPASMAALALGAVALIRRRRR